MGMYQSYICPVKGDKILSTPHDGIAYTYQEVLEIIGGTPDVLLLDDGRCMVCAGIVEGTPEEVNVRATILSRQQAGLFAPVIGDALVTDVGLLGDWYEHDDEPDGDDYYET